MLLPTNWALGNGRCECGHLPYTISVTFAGLPETGRTSYARMYDSACFGFAAEVVALAPGGNRAPEHEGDPPSDAGPLSQVKLLKGGYCYAKRGRIPPELVVSGGGTGATFNVLLSQQTDACGIPTWAIQSVAVEGGSGYPHNSVLNVALSPGDSVELPALLRIQSAGGVPTGVQVLVAGRYYHEVWSNDVAPYVADVFFRSGTSVVRGVVDSDVNSPTFGEVVGVTIEDPGEDFLAWQHEDTCLSRLNGQTLVLRDTISRQLVRICPKSNWGVPPSVRIDVDKYDGVPGPIPGLVGYFRGGGLAKKGRQQPELTFYTFVGSGASFTPEFEQWEDRDGLPQWSITAVATNGEGSGYVDGTRLFIEGEDLSAVVVPILLVRAHTEPTVSASVQEPDSFVGTPAALEVTLQRRAGFPTAWSIASVEVTDQGSGYDGAQPVLFSVAMPGVAYINAAALAIVNSDGNVVEVRIDEPGAYYVNHGKPVEIAVVRGGELYQERDDLPPYVATVDMAIEQVEPSAGSGAVIEVGIDTDPTSPSFGHTTGVTLVDGGEGYTLLGGSGGDYQVACLAGGAVIVRLLNNSVSLNYGLNRGIELQLLGSGDSPTPFGYRTLAHKGVFRSEGTIIDASSLPAALPASHDIAGGSVALQAGGRYIGPMGPCCQSCPAGEVGGRFESLESCIVTLELQYAPCNIDGTYTLILDERFSDGEVISGELFIGDGRFRAVGYISFSRGYFWIGIVINSCQQLPVYFQLIRNLVLEAVRVDDQCLPVGFSGWQWEVAEPGAPYLAGVPGNEIPNEYGELKVTVSAAMVFQ